jgi:rSAM/selenodomain-associated transferase 2
MMAWPMRLSIVVPALNAEKILPACLAALGAWDGAERILVDGGSTDATRDMAAGAGWRVIAAPRGRGVQLSAGAQAATGDTLLFVHADTVLQPGWTAAVANFAGEAGFFRLEFDRDDPRASRVARLANCRARVWGLPYGDQGLLIDRALYERLGGYRPLPLMEDVDLVRRIGRARMRQLDGVARTSAARYERDGWVLRPLRNLSILTLWFLGVKPETLARLYR